MAQTKLPPLYFSREQFADYWTSLLSRIRQDDECEQVYTGILPHPIITLQQENQQQIISYQLTLVAEAVLQVDPIAPAEKLLASIQVAATAAGSDPPLTNLWSTTVDNLWPLYKRALRKIYAITVATLQVGTSMHYARSVPYGSGLQLLRTIHEDNRQNTTRSLFALIGSLFTLKLKEGERIETFRQRFELITNRCSNWVPPITFPDSLLLFFVLRGLPDQPYGPTKHIILATENISLSKGLRLLRDVGQSEAGLITSTLGSGSTADQSKILAATPPQPEPEKPKRKKKQKTKLCLQHGPCMHHGPKSLHATCECRDPTLSRRKKRQPATTSSSTPNLMAPTSTQQPAPSVAPYHQPFSYAPAYPPMLYQQYPPHIHPAYFQQPPPTLTMPQTDESSTSTVLLAIADPAYDADDDEDDDYSEDENDEIEHEQMPLLPPPVVNTFVLESRSQLEALIEHMDYDSDTDTSDISLRPSRSPSPSVSTRSDRDASISNTIAPQVKSSSDSSDEEPPPLVPYSHCLPSDTPSDSSDTELDIAPPAAGYPQHASSEDSEQPGGLTCHSDTSSDTYSSDSDYDDPPPAPPRYSPPDYTVSSDSSTDSTPVFTSLSPREFDAVVEAFKSPWKRHTHARDPRFQADTIDLVVLEAVCLAFVQADHGLHTFHPLSNYQPVLITTIKPVASSAPASDGSTTEEEPVVVPVSATIPVSTTSVTTSKPATSATSSSSESSAKPQAPHDTTHAAHDDDATSSVTSETLDYDPSDFFFKSSDNTTYYVVAVGPKPAIFATEDQMINSVTNEATGKIHSMAVYGPRVGLHAAEQMIEDYKQQAEHFVPDAIKPTSRRRRPRNYHWSKKGTKQSRREARAKTAKRSVTPPPASAASYASTFTPPSTPQKSSSSSASTNKCLMDGCSRLVGKRYDGTYFMYCFHHRHLGTSPRTPVTKASARATTRVRSPLNPDVDVKETTNHAAAAASTVSSDFQSKLPKLRRARCVYAYAQGLHTKLHYPQEFLVTLNGEPAVRTDWSVSPCMVSGNANAAEALKHVIHVVANRDVRPKSLCNHRGCIYNQGDLITRRNRFLACAEEINRQLASSSDYTTPAYLVTHSPCKDVIIDSGAGRHIQNDSSRFSAVQPCSPQTLTGFTGRRLTITTCGQVGNFTNVLHVPSAHASVRSVSAALDARGGQIIFSPASVTYVSPSGKSTIIGRRTNYGVYALIPDTMPPPSAPVPLLIAAPVQVRREAIHRLHQSLGHASIERMRHAIKHCPAIAGSLTTRDLTLFTTCPACQVGKCKSARRPKSTPTRSALIGYRLHADTTGTIRPSTRGGYCRALIIVDDASRWVFVELLRTASMEEVSRKFEKILRAIAGDAHILQTRVVRTDNGTEFINSAITQLFAQAGIQHERTCPHTSHQNGVAERAIGRLMPVVRTMIADASAEPTFWGEAILAAAHVINRMPTSANDDNMSPFQVRFNRIPSIAHLQPWGITAYVRTTDAQTKVMPRAHVGILVGYGHEVTNQKGWRIYLPSKQAVVTSTSVAFHRSLQESVQQRDTALRSTTLPEQHFAQPPTATPYPLPAVPPPIITTPVSAIPQPPASASISASPPPPAPPPRLHPICQRGSAGPTIQPRQLQNQKSVHHMTTRSMSTGTSPSWSDVITNTDTDTQSTTPQTPRPRGRPPKNHTWDSTQGKYVPVNVVTSPSVNRAWILAALNSDLVTQHQTPVTYQQAISGPDSAHWIKAIQSELQSLKSCSVWKLVVLTAVPKNSKPIPTKWVFKIKGDGAGNVARYKARLVVCGYRQKFGRDYDLTFAPVAHAASIRMVLAMAVAHGMYLRQFDVKTAFLYGELPEHQSVYLVPPTGVAVPSGYVLKLDKAMYGLKQAPLMWNRHLNNTLCKFGFTRCQLDPCVYFKNDTATSLVLAVVVDDIILAGSTRQATDVFASQLQSVYTITDLGVPTRLVGLNISVQPDKITLDQNQFVKDLAARFKQSNCKSVTSPAAPGDVPEGASPLLPPNNQYLSLVGSLLWASISRPDIAVAVSIACSKAVSPTKADLHAAIRILRYLLHTDHIRLTFRKHTQPPPVSVYVDAAWSNAPKSRSRFGYIVCIFGCPVMWCSKLTTMVCLSTAESEYIAATQAVKSALWLTNMLAQLQNTHPNPITVYEDNQACIKMATNPVVSARNRHFSMRMWWLRQQVEDGRVHFRHVATQHQLADIFTKVLPSPIFITLRDSIMSGMLLLRK